MDTLSTLVIQFGPKFQVFIPMIQRVLKKHSIKHSHYDTLILHKCKEDAYSSEDYDVSYLMKIKSKAYNRPRNMRGLTATDTTSIQRVMN